MLESFLLGNDNSNSFAVRRDRSEMMKLAFEEKDLDYAVSVLRLGHDNNTDNFRAGARLRGRNPNIEKRLSRYRKGNKSHYVPAFFQTNSNQNVDTFSTILQVSDGQKALGNTEKEAIEDVRGWMSDYKNYWSKMEDQVHEALEADMITNSLKSRFLTEESADFLSEDDFLSGPIEIAVPFLKRNGEGQGFNRIEFQSLDRLRNYVEEKERIRKLIFAANIADNYFRKSRVYDVMLDQAIIYRRLELAYRRLNEVGQSNLDRDQMRLLGDLKKLMESRSDLRPRSDMVEILQKKEFRVERKFRWRMWRSQRVANDAKYKIPTAVLKDSESISPHAVMTKYLGVTAGVTIVAGLVGNMILPLEEVPLYQYVLALIENKKNDFLLWSVGMTPALLTCAKSEREFSLKTSNMNNFLKSHLNRYRLLSRLDEEYDHNEDPYVQERERELRVLCHRHRNDQRLAEEYAINILEMESSYLDTIDDMFIELIRENSSQHEKLEEQLLELFSYQGDEKNKILALITEIAKIDELLGSKLNDYMGKREEAAKTLKEIGSLPKYRSLDEFIEQLDRRYN